MKPSVLALVLLSSIASFSFGLAEEVSAVARLGQLIGEDESLHRLFATGTTVQATGNRAYVAKVDGNVIYGASLFRVNSKGDADRLGAMFCRSALLTPAKAEHLNAIQNVVGDSWTAKDYLASKEISGKVSGVTFNVKEVSNDWHLAICSAEKANVVVSFVAVVPSELPKARYRAAKNLFTSGSHGDVLGLFRKLRSETDIYPNAIPFIIAILAIDSENLALTINDSHRHCHVWTPPVLQGEN